MKFLACRSMCFSNVYEFFLHKIQLMESFEPLSLKPTQDNEVVYLTVLALDRLVWYSESSKVL